MSKSTVPSEGSEPSNNCKMICASPNARPQLALLLRVYFCQKQEMAGSSVAKLISYEHIVDTSLSVAQPPSPLLASSKHIKGAFCLTCLSRSWSIPSTDNNGVNNTSSQHDFDKTLGNKRLHSQAMLLPKLIKPWQFSELRREFSTPKCLNLLLWNSIMQSVLFTQE